ncbi:SDR family NAD(P)-dependent oxidoreductase [Citrobacter koseri]|uniref:SDR family NAD(P)-dependent oxidoreductase n=1 Tax=Citrobacter koseri TaxID=545 RepID=UPI001DAB3BC6|nr:SDR family oxidoreductase [Citrobacter koseri]CAG0264785.1 3-oxoacyl-[acyl-carrier-protein] reductase FabG [Citrobacter koseri]CAH6100465.1 3-oxoacyl-[acyl-carrier-protein] reductase FabG [Citrobacter koseri]
MNKTALITGASSGIGAVYAERLARQGYDLVLVARRRERLEQLADKIREQFAVKITVHTADLGEESGQGSVSQLIERNENLSFLVNCAGLGALGFAENIAWSEMDNLIKVNVQALSRLSLVASKRFINEKQGTIVNIGSIVAHMPSAGAGAYSASKAYVLNFTRALHAELSQHGAFAQVVMPGPVKSEFFGDKPAPFPEHLFMSPETLVDTALTALAQGESVCYPTLPQLQTWQEFEMSRGKFMQTLTQSGNPAERYQA